MGRITTLRAGDREYRIEVQQGRVLVDGIDTFPAKHALAAAQGDRRWVFLDGEVYEFEVQHPGRRRVSDHEGSLSAPMPATVRQINVVTGATVTRGDTLLVLEAMKMELPVRAGADGKVKSICCREGDLVQPGVVLVVLE